MSKKRILMYILIPFVFIALLTSGRLFWLNQFKPTAQPTIENGILDLREWDFTKSPTFSLDGEWQFLAHRLTTSVDDFQQNDVKTIPIPGDWSPYVNDQQLTPFGYGTYHLRILVDPNETIPFSARVASIRSSSAFYANNELAGESGKVSKNGSIEHDFNVPYTTSTIRANEEGIIDLIIQVANRSDPRSAGIIRSMTFGAEETLLNQTELSIFLQIAAVSFFLVFFIFCFILYFIGWKDRRLLYFAIVLGIIMFINLSGGDDKLLMKHLKMSYDFSYKLSFSCFVLAGLALVQCVRPQLQNKVKYVFHFHAVIALAAIIVCIILPVDTLTYASLFSISYLILSMIIAGIVLFATRKQLNGGILLSLAALAFAHQFIWYAYSLHTGIKTMYYPFDLMIGLTLLASVWLKNYYQTYRNTERYAEKLKIADEARDEFLANTSHELRNPLNGILNISEAVLKREAQSLQPKSRKDLQTVQAVGRRMALMVNDLLDFTRIKQQKPKLNLQSIALRQIVNHSIDIVQFMTDGKNIHFVNEVPTDFPFVQADEYKLQQILFNLLHNAVKFTNEGTITISATITNGTATIAVHDTGQGMSQQTSRQIFDSFYQEQTNEGGFGIGLSLTKKLVELHGGTIQVTSTLGKETTFCFTMPLASEQTTSSALQYTTSSETSVVADSFIAASEEMDVQAEQPKMAVQQSTTQQADKKRILVVDDDPVNLQVVTSILSDDRFDITTVLSGTEALMNVTHSKWDLLITDIMMPHMTGYELVQKIRKRFSLTELPILLLTARARETEIEYGFSIGANDYVTKPVSAIELTSRVHALIDVKTSAEERLQMEAAWLQAQIQPHFLFNTLNTILALSELDIERMQKLLEAFNALLRRKFQFQRSDELWPIQEEIDFVKNYVYIEQERFGERITINWDIDDDVMYPIPSLSIQPLVENAIRHGILRKDEGGTITIRAKSYDKHAVIEVVDDGVGMDNETIRTLFRPDKEHQFGVGLSNVNARLQKFYGEPLTIKSQVGKGTSITFNVYRLS